MRHDWLSIVHLERSGSEEVRVAFAIGRAAGSAVARNRIRRRIWHVLHDLRRDHPQAVPVGEYLIMIRDRVPPLSAAELRHVVTAALQRLEASR
ncbi:MAG: ribonuclease P protein component [Acidimicrobiia bacterium]|nr:ribonuclease P protein component [Acidimicrobiia bacterium]